MLATSRAHTALNRSTFALQIFDNVASLASVASIPGIKIAASITLAIVDIAKVCVAQQPMYVITPGDFLTMVVATCRRSRRVQRNVSSWLTNAPSSSSSLQRRPVENLSQMPTHNCLPISRDSRGERPRCGGRRAMSTISRVARLAIAAWSRSEMQCSSKCRAARCVASLITSGIRIISLSVKSC
jgi:hypothetical protein